MPAGAATRRRATAEEPAGAAGQRGAARLRRRDTTAIKVKGHDDLLVYRARCCNPIRGEEIVGYVTRGKGVAVHSKSCPNVENLMYEPERRIAVEWSAKEPRLAGTQPSYPVKLRYSVTTVPACSSTITAVISDANTNIRNIEAKTRRNRTPPSTSCSTSPMSQHLNRIITGVRKIPGVHEVQRVQKL